MLQKGPPKDNGRLRRFEEYTGVKLCQKLQGKKVYSKVTNKTKLRPVKSEEDTCGAPNKFRGYEKHES